jgi:biopolymer transport protein ExbB/TolQ
MLTISEFNRISTVIRSGLSITDKPFFVQSHLTIASERLENDLVSKVMPLERGLYLLAMISSLAPFLGLLGTVWGIMNAFFEIGKQGSASLSIVAPGIAEALITTIVGLGVAIPALFFYNYLNQFAERIVKQAEEFKDNVLLKLKCDILDVLYNCDSIPDAENVSVKSSS